MSDHEDPTTPRTNVVVILTDDLGWGDLGCYGSDAIPTPAIDRLAAQGVRFVDAHGASAVCTPSRYALMTGRYPWRSPLKQGVLGGFDPPLIEPDRATVATALGAAGYACGYFGKWHLGLGWTRQDGTRRNAFTEPGLRGDLGDAGRDVDYAAGLHDGPRQHGFDTFFGVAGSLDMAPYCFLADDQVVGVPDQEKDVSDDTGQRPGLTVAGWRDDQADLIMVDHAVDWIGEQVAVGTPFFAMIATMSPHRPCVPPVEFRGASTAGRRGDAVVLVDHLVSQVVAAIEPVAESTVVIFTSDNGAPMNYPEDGDVFQHRPNGGWRGQKADAWEGGHRIPLIINGPGVAAGGTSTATVSLLDLLPTLVELTGCAEPAADLDGRSFAPAVGDPSAPLPERILGVQALNGMLALRHRSRKAILGTGSGGFTELRGHPTFTRGDPGQLYDLADDPAELCNRWRQDPDEAWAWFDAFVAGTGFDVERDLPLS